MIKRDPEVIFITHTNYDGRYERDPAWVSVSAVRNKKVFSDINPDLMVRPGRRFIDGIEEMGKRIYKDW